MNSFSYLIKKEAMIDETSEDEHLKEDCALNLSIDIRKIMLGERVQCTRRLSFNVDNLQHLNKSQRLAVENAFNNHVSLIQVNFDYYETDMLINNFNFRVLLAPEKRQRLQQLSK